MSRIGKQHISIPSGVTVTTDTDQVAVSGPKGELKQPLLDGIKVETTNEGVQIQRSSEEPQVKGAHGLMRSLVANMVTGVSQGFEKKLEVNGVGYRVALQGDELQLSLGLSHPLRYKLPPEIQAKVEQNVITLSSIDKQKLGQVASEIRALKKPEPYKGKGIKYVDEEIIRKSGKSGKEAAA